jgi:hypothetical protein
MRNLFLQCLAVIALLTCAPLVHAQHVQPVYRCIGAHGEPVFSGQPCGTPAPASATSAATQGNTFGAVCAGSPRALRQAIASAFAIRDVNQFAGLILWNGMDQNSARAALRALAAWLKQPLTGIAIARTAGPPPTNAGAPPAASTAAPAGASSVTASPPTGFDVSTGGVDGTTRDFGLVESGGCWWLTF